MKLSFYLPLYKVIKQSFLLLLLLRGAGEEVLFFVFVIYNGLDLPFLLRSRYRSQ